MDTLHRLEEALSGRYRIQRPLGEGGMALVFLAEDLKHHRPVALKVLRPEISAALGTERFLREIDVAAGLNHPNILALHDSGEAGGLLYFVMPFVEGESLRERLEREVTLALDDVLRIADEVGNALDYAHARGLVHRDIKPENILFQAGHGLVADLGVAQMTGGEGDRLTRTGVAVGTFAYMSPEQLSGSDSIDGRSDVYALGCVVHEMLSGSNPFRATTAQASLARKLTGQIPDVSEGRDDLPATLQAVVGRALSVEPGNRFSTAGEFVEALRTATTRSEIEADERRRRRRKMVRWAGAALGLVAIAATSWAVNRAVAGPSMKRIALLPLQNAQPDPEEDYFVQGAWADLVFELSDAFRDRGVAVIATESAARAASRGLTIREIAEDLGIDGVITGRVSVEPDSVSFQMELVDGRTLENIWGERFPSSTGNIVGTYRRIALAIADGIGLRIEADERAGLAQAQEVDPDLYRALLQARFNWQKLTAEGIDTAEDYYNQAVLLSDSTSAEAWWGLHTIWGMRAQMGLASMQVAQERGRVFRARAEALDPGLALRDRGYNAWFEWDFGGAVRGMAAEAEENPNDPVVRAFLALALLWSGDEAAAEREIRRAVEMDPYNPRVLSLQGQILNFTRRFDEAAELFERILRREPNEPIALSNLRTVYHHLGRFEEAIPIWRSYYASRGDSVAVRALERGYEAGGYRAGLRAVAEEFASRPEDERRALYWQIATLYTRAGDDEPAIDYIELAARDEDANVPYITIDPLFDHLRDDPRFQAVIDAIDARR